MNFEYFLKIRKEWALQLPDMMKDYEERGMMGCDPYFMDWLFTPIENSVWCDIRSNGLPFYPQFPVLNYFLDFACPFLKIGIECDGKDWHDKDKDAIRDKRLQDEGWVIYRIEGHECKRQVDLYKFWDEGEEPDAESMIEYYMNTSEGIIKAIKKEYFGSNERIPDDLLWMTLNAHRSTIDNYARPKEVKESMPQRFSTEKALRLIKLRIA